MTINELSVCEDCLRYCVSGDEALIESLIAGYLTADECMKISQGQYGRVLYPAEGPDGEDLKLGFSNSACETCGKAKAGDRYLLVEHSPQ